MGWFQHGSTIVLLAPRGHAPCADIHEGKTIKVGQKLLALPSP